MKRRSRTSRKAVKTQRRKSANSKPPKKPGVAGSFRRLLERVKKAHFPAEGDPTLDWLKPFMNLRTYRKGDVVFRKGDAPNEMFLVETGRFVVAEMDVELLPGRFFGEVGFFAPGKQRAMTVECTDGGDVLCIAYEKLLMLFVQNPEFSFHSLALSVAGTVRLSRLLVELREKNAELERSHDLAREQASRLQTQARELALFNEKLEQQVAHQVGEIERIGRLRRFLPPQVADLIVASGMEKQLESHRREITALFCDLRGFTGFSESSDPEDVMALLSEYHAGIGEIIIKYSGTLERYAGDGVMVVTRPSFCSSASRAPRHG